MEPLIFRSYQTYTHRSVFHRPVFALERVHSEKQWIQRHVGQVEPGNIGFRSYQVCMQRASFHSVLWRIRESVFRMPVFALKRIKHENQRIQRHVGQVEPGNIDILDFCSVLYVYTKISVVCRSLRFIYLF